MTSVRIGRRFQGPARSGNGGYVAGLVGTALAAELGDGVVPQVTLRVPPPMEVDLELVATADGGQLLDGTSPIATAVPVETSFLVDATVEPVAADDARAAEASYKGLSGHPFPSCFVCGPENAEGLQLRPGPIGDGRVACTWAPGAGLTDAVFLWAALDCPGGWAIDLEGRPSVLGQLTACVDAQPQVGEECVAVGRVLGEEGRKTFTASTLYDSDGRVLARARHTWIMADPAAFN
ncbi:PaaI family thioesterase [Kribbella sp. NPDC051587]|uniref:PaaI family thioesterase n=1 Tax=Kribbella sp. NPDC051587 TaxID=3364119 RepID=UPI0037B3DF05